MGDIRGGARGGRCPPPPPISSVMESLMSAQVQLYGVLDGAKYPQMKANTIKRSGKLSNVFLQRWAMYPIKDISVDFFNAMANRKRCHFSEFTHSWKRGVLHARLVNHLMMTSLTVRSHRRRRERQNSLWPPCQRRCRKTRWRSDDRTLVLYLKEPKRKQACWSCADWPQVGYKLKSLNILIVKVRNWSMERAL